MRVAYTADPTQRRHRGDAIGDYGWVPIAPDGTVLYPQPDGAKMIFPTNDHPSLRAPITFLITTPPGVSAVANGRLVERAPRPDGRVLWTYDSEQPVAAQLVQMAIGKFTFVESTGPHGLPVCDVVPWGPGHRDQGLSLAHARAPGLAGAAARPRPVSPLRRAGGGHRTCRWRWRRSRCPLCRRATCRVAGSTPNVTSCTS